MDIQQVIKEIGRGKLHARHLDLTSAEQLYRAMLADEVDDMSLGAILIALRIKGEGEEELLGFYRALREFLPQWATADSNTLILPSYNGARRQANLTPLLALLLHKLGFKVFIHGTHRDPTRITSEQIFKALNINPASDVEMANEQFSKTGFSFITLDKLCPALAKQLDLRWHLGLRNSAHTLAKLISPFAENKGLRLTSVSHPEYLPKVTQFFIDIKAKALVSNGCEGEVYMNPQRPSAIQYVDPSNATVTEIIPRHAADTVSTAASKQVEESASWITQVLAGKIPVPESLRTQIASCLVATGRQTSIQQAMSWISEQGY